MRDALLLIAFSLVVSFTSVTAMTLITQQHENPASIPSRVHYLETEMKHPGNWDASIDEPGLINNRTYSVLLNRKSAPLRTGVQVFKDDAGQRWVKLWPGADESVMLKEGVCALGSPCEALPRSEWRTVFDESVAFARRLGAHV